MGQTGVRSHVQTVFVIVVTVDTLQITTQPTFKFEYFITIWAYMRMNENIMKSMQ